MKVITTGLLNRFWTKGIKPWLDKRIKSYADLMVTTASGYTPDALAVKEGFTELNGKLLLFYSIEITVNREVTVDEITSYSYSDYLDSSISAKYKIVGVCGLGGSLNAEMCIPTYWNQAVLYVRWMVTGSVSCKIMPLLMLQAI